MQLKVRAAQGFIRELLINHGIQGVNSIMISEYHGLPYDNCADKRAISLIRIQDPAHRVI